MPQRKSDRDDVQLVKRPESSFWQIRWYDAARRKMRHLSTRTTDRAEAERIRAEFVLRSGNEADPPTQTATNVSPPHRVADILDVYWNDHAKHLPSADQAKAARKHLMSFFGDAAVATLTVERQEDYVTARHDLGIKPSTISRELSVLRAAVHHAGLGTAIRIYDVGETVSRGRWLTPEEFQKLLRACKSPHTRLYMLLGIATAGRPEAILDLKWSQVDLVSGVIHLNPEGRIQTNKRRPTVRIDLPLMEALRQAKMSARTEWVIEYNGYAINSIKTAFREAAATAGFPPETSLPMCCATRPQRGWRRTAFHSGQLLASLAIRTPGWSRSTMPTITRIIRRSQHRQSVSGSPNWNLHPSFTPLGAKARSRSR